jgi:CHAT domain-containing protein
MILVASCVTSGNEVVSPIVDLLQTTVPPRSRIWWCPTAEFSLLPLHAAGPYRRGKRNLSHLYISSYTPTLTALIRARRNLLLEMTSIHENRFLAIGQATGNGQSKLLSVGSELGIVAECIQGLAKLTRLEGSESSVSRVSEELKKNEWVHFACHGVPDEEKPFESAFALHDGPFTIQRIMGCELEHPEFAYLSACHTKVRYKEGPDEVIHLASVMQFAGFRSVIRTMWAVDDAQTNTITTKFYENMLNGCGRLDHTRAALALQRTMNSLAGIVPLDQRILYVHIGA